MPPKSLDQLLAELERSKTQFGPAASARIHQLLTELAPQPFPDARSLIRFHEALLFLRAYPQDPSILRLADELLLSFADRVAQLRSTGADLSPFEEPEVSGIAGTSLTAIFFYPVACRLAQLFPNQVDIDWQGYDKTERLGATLPRFLSLLEDDALVEANIPCRDWLQAARGRPISSQLPTDLAWLLQRFAGSPLSYDEKAELYESLELLIHFSPGDSSATRSRTRLPVSEFFYHDAPLLRRSDISLPAAFQSPPLPLQRLPRARGQTMLDMALATSALRYRQLYAFTHGDPARVLKADAGRGVHIYLFGVPPERRLPLRACHAALLIKNGVLIGYFEGLSLFDRLETGFNIYYTFREGESAWLFGRLLRLLNQVFGVTCFSVEPYQIGFHNPEAIDSGAFWFYRKLGFRPIQPALARLVASEEQKIRANPSYRTPARLLRRIAQGYLVFEAPGARQGDWDRFQVRHLGFAVQRRMAEQFDGDARKMRRASSAAVARALGVHLAHWNPTERRNFQNLALVLSLIPDLSRWAPAEKQAAARILRAKAAPDEALYLRLLQRHPRLRAALLELTRPG
jgi:hypothetical protein